MQAEQSPNPSSTTDAGASSELDALVAEKVMSWAKPAPYSTDITAAWDVFEFALLNLGNARIDADMEDYGRGMFFGDGPERVVTVTVGEHSHTAPVCEAICRATLAAFDAARASADCNLCGKSMHPQEKQAGFNNHEYCERREAAAVDQP